MIYKIIRKLYRLLKALVKGPFWYIHDLASFVFATRSQLARPPLYVLPFIFDRDPAAHTFDKHYTYMDRWAFKHIQEQKPQIHVDVGSSIRFLSMATTVTKIQYVDIRPVALDFENFSFQAGDISKLPFPDNSILSLSCLHVAEHIGLGRYGDSIDVEGTEKACKELQRVLAPGGVLYFALPVGKTAVYFNAHRVHNPKTILEYFDVLKLVDFSVINDAGHFVSSADPYEYANSQYACGCFVFTKPRT
jgi:ubiquinone/menaquinone biosynthesis C-methylase UbiE